MVKISKALIDTILKKTAERIFWERGTKWHMHILTRLSFHTNARLYISVCAWRGSVRQGIRCRVFIVAAAYLSYGTK